MRKHGQKAILIAAIAFAAASLGLAQEPTRRQGKEGPPGRPVVPRQAEGAGRVGPGQEFAGRGDWREAMADPEVRRAMMVRGGFGGVPATPSFLARNIEIFDSDGDGALTQKEYEAGMREIFAYVDANNDGKIDRSEINRDLTAVFVAPATRSRHLLRQYDRNNDGKITPDECLLPPKAFAPLDSNNSGALENEDLLKLTPTQATVLQDPARRASVLLAELDKNADKQLSAEEFTFAKEAFKAADRNADGRIDAEEMKVLPPLPLEHPQRRSEDMIARMDQDGDKMLSQNEFRFPGVQFDDVDANKDGLLDLKELTAWYETGRGRQFGPPSPVEMADRWLDQFDRNGDGKLSKEELKGVPEATWQRWDLNADGVVDATEIEKSFDARRMDGRMMRPVDAPDRPRGELLRGNPAGMIKQRDQDEDGKLTRAEMGVDERVFQRMDRDGDGKVTAEELTAAQEFLRSRGPDLREKMRERRAAHNESKR